MKNTDPLYLSPGKKQLFRPLFMTPLNQVRVMLLGEMPSPRSDGLAYSSQSFGYENANLDTRMMICEAMSDMKIPEPNWTTLAPWAREGVLMWNIRPISRPGKRFEDLHYEFKNLSIEIIQSVIKLHPNVVIAYTSREVKDFLDEHTPSGYNISRVEAPDIASGKFFGCKLFSRINKEIEKKKAGSKLKWRLS